MSLRRRDSRFDFVNTDGVLRVWRDVIGHRTAAGEYLVISNEAGVKGEHLTIYLASSTHRPISVRVLDSRPTIVDGSMRHQLRLIPLERETLGQLETTSNGDLEAE